MPRPKQLTEHEQLIRMLIAAEYTHEQILDHLEDATGLRPSRRTLARRLLEWKLTTSSTIDDSMADHVHEMLEHGLQQEEILDNLESGGAGRPSLRQLQNRTRLWGCQRLPALDGPMKQLVDGAIDTHFRESSTTDQAYAEMIQTELGVALNYRAIGVRRRAQGLRKRIGNGSHEQYRNELRGIIVQEVNKGRIENLGRTMLFTFLRAHYGKIGRSLIFDVLKEINPRAVDLRRSHKTARPPRTAVVQGPNFAWSMDAHCKFEAFGMQIYAAIDVYSRHIMWCYVGITARTAVSVVAQYVKCIRESGIMPQIIRSDRGAETVIAADVHYMLRQSTDTRTDPERDPLGFRDCFRFGTSKQNQRIEQWWGQMSKGMTSKWRTAFEHLAESDDYDVGRRSHRIAFLAVFIPIIREEVYHYIYIWNIHRIRKQKKRPYSVPGIPKTLYNFPMRSGGKQCAVRVPVHNIEGLQEDLEPFDIDEYLPPTTLQWCQSILEMEGFDGLSGSSFDTETGDRLCFTAFKTLRDRVVTHMDTGFEPQLTESEKPFNGRSWGLSTSIQALWNDAGQTLANQTDVELV